MAVSSATLISDTVKFMRDFLSTNITDPLAGQRGGRERFVVTSFPQRPVTYPIIQVECTGPAQGGPAGMSSNLMVFVLPVEIRVWARNVKERDAIAQEVIDDVRQAQFTAGTGTIANNLHDFSVMSAANIYEEGEGPKSKVIQLQFLFITE
jgi:hypothetical protein